MTCPCVEATIPAQSIAVSGVETPVTFDAPTLNEAGLDFNTAARITFPSTAQIGRYLVAAQIEYDANATGARGAWLVLRDSGGAEKQRIDPTELSGPNTATSSYPTFDLMLNVAAGDYIEVAAYQESTGALNAQGLVQIIRLDGVPSAQFRGAGATVTITSNTATNTIPTFPPTQDDFGSVDGTSITNRRWLLNGASLEGGWATLAVALVAFTANATNTRSCSLFWEDSGATVQNRGVGQQRAAPASVETRCIAGTVVWKPSAGDYLRLETYQNSGGNLATTKALLRMALVQALRVWLGGGGSPATTTSGVEDLFTSRNGTFSSSTDTLGMRRKIDTVDNRWVINFSGRYIVFGNFGWGNNATGYRQAIIYHRDSGGTLLRSSMARTVATPVTNGTTTFHTLCLIIPHAVVGDYLEFGVLQTSGGSLGGSTGVTTYGMAVIQVAGE